jgi:hypothetical protein
MDRDQAMKHKFIVVYDYGTGGLWKIIEARSKEEILAKFKDLKIFEPRPIWMSDDKYNDLERKIYDIDSQPTGWLARLLR